MGMQTRYQHICTPHSHSLRCVNTPGYMATCLRLALRNDVEYFVRRLQTSSPGIRRSGVLRLPGCGRAAERRSDWKAVQRTLPNALDTLRHLSGRPRSSHHFPEVPHLPAAAERDEHPERAGHRRPEAAEVRGQRARS